MLGVRPIVFVSTFFTVAAGALWGLGIAALAGTWEFVDPRALPADLAGAGSASVIAALCWVTWRRDLADKDKTVLVKTLARTLPLPRVP